MPCMQSLFSHVWLFVTPWTVAHQAPLSMGLPRPEYWSGLPFPPPRDLPSQGSNHVSCNSCTAGGFFTAEPNPSQIRIPQLAEVIWVVLGQNHLDLFKALLFPLLSLHALPLTSSSSDVTLSHSQFLWLVSAKASPCSLSPPSLWRWAFHDLWGFSHACSLQFSWPAWRWRSHHSVLSKCLPSKAL